MLGAPAGAGDSTRTAPRETLTHEMVHHWATGLSEEAGAAAWFNEGLATYYARLLGMRAGLLPIDAFLTSVNATAQAYYTSPVKNLSADSLRRLGFSMGVGRGSAQNVPYVRGSLFFADLDARLREASGGVRGLDDLLVPMFERIRAGARVDRAGFVGELVRALGPDARERFEAVIVRGETIVPRSDAFGPCFERRAVRMKEQDREVQGYEWVRVAGVPDSACRR
jgi:predicted metalloprotease with PDZ domain